MLHIGLVGVKKDFETLIATIILLCMGLAFIMGGLIKVIKTLKLDKFEE